jgi:allophanate hydrolase
VAARPGSRVAKGDKLVSLEAMKMETILTAPHDGTVAGVYVNVGTQVAAGQVLLAVLPDEDPSGAARVSPVVASSVERVRAAYAAIGAARRPEVWITLRPTDEALAEAATIDARVADGEELPLAGLVAAVKDNIDVAGLPTTAAAPSFAYQPAVDATAVARLRAAGAVVLGKTNLDQFATGLVGTRSPYGAVRNAWDPARISGGSSSGSAVAVALGLVDLALGTDTAGSGRVPAALNGMVGVKPTRGVIPATGVVPACRSLDCVTVFARSLDLASNGPSR